MTAPDERDRIRAAMDRILNDKPEHSSGALTIVALAHEAGVPRNALTQRHPDLKNEFYARVKERGATPDDELRLRKTIRKLKKTLAERNSELAQARVDRIGLVRAVNQLTLENEQLRAQLELPEPRIVPLHNRRSPHGRT